MSHFQDKAINYLLCKPGLISLCHRDQPSPRWQLLCQQVPNRLMNVRNKTLFYKPPRLGDCHQAILMDIPFFEFCSFTHAFSPAWNLHAPSLLSLAISYGYSFQTQFKSLPFSQVFSDTSRPFLFYASPVLSLQTSIIASITFYSCYLFT